MAKCLVSDQTLVIYGKKNIWDFRPLKKIEEQRWPFRAHFLSVEVLIWFCDSRGFTLSWDSGKGWTTGGKSLPPVIPVESAAWPTPSAPAIVLLGGQGSGMLLVLKEHQLVDNRWKRRLKELGKDFNRSVSDTSGHACFWHQRSSYQIEDHIKPEAMREHYLEISV